MTWAYDTRQRAITLYTACHKMSKGTFQIAMFPPIDVSGYGRVYAVWTHGKQHREHGLLGCYPDMKSQMDILAMLMSQCFLRMRNEGMN